MLCLIATLFASTGCGPSGVKDMDGRPLPAVGAEARFVEKHGWLAKDEAALAELMTPPKIDLRTMSPQQAGQRLDAALAQNAARLIKEGKAIQVPPGSKVRILGYYTGDSRSIRPLAPDESSAAWVKVEVLEGQSRQKTGFTTADGVAK